MRPFDYIAVGTIAEACGVLAEHGPEACVLAGGTDLLVEWRRASKQAPRVALDISRVRELSGIAELDGGISLKPLVTHSRMVRSELLQKSAPLLAAAAGQSGHDRQRRIGRDCPICDMAFGRLTGRGTTRGSDQL